MTHLPSAQLSFEGFLETAALENSARQIERETGHLPSSMPEGIAYYRLLIRHHHAAMLAANVDEVVQLREEAHLLAVRLNGGKPGILAGDSAPGCVLARETAAVPGAVPLWGQQGNFIIDVAGMRVRIELDGMFGIGSGFWSGFDALAVEYDRPFLSDTGYRSFLSVHAAPVPNLMPDEFAGKVIATHVARELNGELVAIEPRYRKEEGA